MHWVKCMKMAFSWGRHYYDECVLLITNFSFTQQLVSFSCARFKIDWHKNAFSPRSVDSKGPQSFGFASESIAKRSLRKRKTIRLHTNILEM